MNSLISSGLALKGKYKADLPLKSVTNLVTDLIFKTFLEEETSSLTDDSEDFTMKYYAKFLNEVKKKGLEKGYILYVMSVLNNPSIKKVMIAYKDDIEAFELDEEAMQARAERHSTMLREVNRIIVGEIEDLQNASEEEYSSVVDQVENDDL